MPKINILDKTVYNRISAGEVVERPFSIVKELVENSIDAGSTEIVVSISDGGLGYIEVEDNGCGISPEDLPIAFMPHATSKIEKAEDLDSISTLGFRGEALPSIGAVSKVCLFSRIKEKEAGAFIYCYGGKLSEVDFGPKAQGTTVTVDSLFYNTPVRAKFLKTPKSEEAEITNIICRMMLARPDISFNYRVNDKNIFQTYGDGLESAMINVYGYEIINNCFYIETVKNGISIKGYVGKHNFSKANRTYQTLLVNGRYVVNATVNSAISNAYAPYMMKRQYPFYVLNINIAPEFVDVNVHPNKADVRFQNNQVVYGTIYSVITSVLDGTNQALDIVKIDQHKDEEELKKITPVPVEEKKIPDGMYPEDSLFVQLRPYSEGYKNDIYRENDYSIKQEEKQEEKKSAEDIFAQNKAYIERLEREKATQETISIENPLVYIGQAFNTFLIFQKKDDLYIVDQHAAHERLLYDKMLTRSQKSVISQPLIVPYTIKPNPLEDEMLEKMLPYANSIGFSMEKCNNRTYIITMVPIEFINLDFKKFIAELTDEANVFASQSSKLIIEKIMQKACKHAIKAGYKLSQAEIDTLTKKLNGNFGLKCPHGRPIAVKITKTEIYKWFKRIV